MRNLPFLVGFLLVAGGLLLIAPPGRAEDRPLAKVASEAPDPRDLEIQKLKEENARLGARVRELEQELARREPVVKDLKLDLTPVPTRPAAPASPKTPDNWIRREINGMTYYLVPCDTEVKGVGTITVAPKASPAPARR